MTSSACSLRFSRRRSDSRSRTEPGRHHCDTTSMSLWCLHGGEMMPSVDLPTPVRLLRRRRDLRLLLGAGLVSMTGDWILGIGLTSSVYALTGSTLASAVTLLAGFVPQVLARLVAGVFVDRWDRRRTMVV